MRGFFQRLREMIVQETAISENRRWLAVAALAVGAFIFNTTEYVPIALLSDIGATFGMKPTEAGVMMAVYAAIVAFLSLPLMLLTRKIERRKLLMWLFALFAASHVLSFFAWSFNVLLASRIGIALTHAVFWSVTAALAVRIAPKGRSNQALGWLSTGSVMAMVAGIPLGRIVGQWAGWQTMFLIVGLCAAAVMAVLAKNLPLLPSVNTGSLASLPQLFRRPNLMMLYGFTVLMITAHFTAYNYIEPFVLQVGGFAAGDVTVLLLVYGVSGFAGSFVFGKWFAKHPKMLFSGAVAVAVSAMLLMLPLSGSVWGMNALAFAWGVALMLVSLGMQSCVLRFASDATDVAQSVFSGLFNVGIGGGALLGKYAAAALGLPNIGFSGAALASAALLLAAVMVRRKDFFGQNG